MVLLLRCLGGGYIVYIVCVSVAQTLIFSQVNLLAAKAIHSCKSRSTALRFKRELEDWPVGSTVPIRTSPEL